MFMILFVLDASDRCDEILTAWEEAGVSGVTILVSTGLGRVKQKAALREDFPLMPSLEEFFTHEENQNRTLMTIVPDQVTVDRVVEVTQRLIGDLDLPNTGILAVLPVAQVYGLHRKANG
jgi:nitrogen regulatory protein PII